MEIFKSNKLESRFSLNELANIYQTDKGDQDKFNTTWGKFWPELECWGYTNTYEKYMEPYRDRTINFLEIGICDKRFPYASIKMWNDYFVNGEIWGMDNFWGNDLQEKIKDISELNKKGINFIYGDQGNLRDWDNIIEKIGKNKFDFIVEDGSHWPNHMVITLWKCKDLLKSGGYYFMEDLQNPETFRGSMKLDNSLLTEDLLKSYRTNNFYTHFLNEQQNQDIRDNFDLKELILDKSRKIYLAVFKKK